MLMQAARHLRVPWLCCASKLTVRRSGVTHAAVHLCHCASLQADYHQEKFKTFPHVNSPAWLISQIIRKHQVAATEAEEAAADP